MAKGKKTGGRVKGSKNKTTRAKEAAIAASGLTPLEYMLSLLRNTKLPRDVRLEASRSAAPYVHPRLAQMQVTTPPGNPLEFKNVDAEPELIGAYLRRIGAIPAGAAPGPEAGADSGAHPHVGAVRSEPHKQSGHKSARKD